MSLTILNNISSLTAENALSNTQASLQKTLTQLSTGLKINSGADDAAGLSIANGMQANIAALTQSQQNAANGIGLLQTADGALSQVTSLLNRAVTLATEASNAGLTSTQSGALNTEFGNIVSEINQIGLSTDFNGTNVFAGNQSTSFEGTQGSTAASLATTTGLTAGSITTISDSATGGTFVFTAKAGDTVNTLANAVTAAAAAGTLTTGTAVSIDTTTGHVQISDASGASVSTNDAAIGAFTSTAGSTNTVFLSDDRNNAAASITQITTSIAALDTTNTASSVHGLNGKNLSSSTNAQAALTAIQSAIDSVAGQRGNIGASINRLNAASSVMNNAASNLQSATNAILNADIGVTVANMTQYNVLQSTGMAALQQSNQAQQAVLKLVQ